MPKHRLLLLAFLVAVCGLVLVLLSSPGGPKPGQVLDEAKLAGDAEGRHRGLFP
jgi:hypothetical protein